MRTWKGLGGQLSTIQDNNIRSALSRLDDNAHETAAAIQNLANSKTPTAAQVIIPPPYNSVGTLQLDTTGDPDGTKFLRDDMTWQTPPSGSGNGGQATIAFASYLTEDSIAVTGQTSLIASSAISATIYADNDDVYAQDWSAPIVRNVVAGTGFTLTLRPRVGTFKGNVKLNWTWV